jgi:uncharacterized protein DUF1501
MVAAPFVPGKESRRGPISARGRCERAGREGPTGEGGGVKGGRVIGATGEFGLRVVRDRFHVNDLHATVLKLLGLDHHKLTYLFLGRFQRLTDVGADHEFADRLLV